MIMIKKITKDDSLWLRTVLDMCQCNLNTRKLASSLPDIESILRNIKLHLNRSLLNGKDMYEQICITPSDVPNFLFSTPE